MKIFDFTKEHRPDSDEADRGDATSGVARSPSAGEPKVTEPDDYVKRLHEDTERESRLVVHLDLDTIEGLIEARRCVDKHCSDVGRDDQYHAKALRALDRILGLNKAGQP